MKKKKKKKKNSSTSKLEREITREIKAAVISKFKLEFSDPSILGSCLKEEQ